MPRVLTQAQKEDILKMEKEANWWTKYYASRAKLVKLFYIKKKKEKKFLFL